MSTRRSNDLNNLLQRAFRDGALPPSPEAELSLDCERRAKEVGRATTGYPGRPDEDRVFYLPLELLARDLSTLSNAAGAYLVSPADRPLLLPLLKPYSVLANLNVTHLSNLVGNLSLPLVSSTQVAGSRPKTQATQQAIYN